MNEFIVQGTLPLESGGTLVIDEGRDIIVYVWQGLVWVTQEGERRDHLLKRGEWLRVERGGRTLVSALAPSSVALTSPHEEDYAAAISLAGRRHEHPVALYRGRPRSLRALLNRAARAWEAWISPQPGAAGA